jgi:hypothetical protein
MRFGLDYAWGRLTPAQHKAAGSSFACRYLSHDAGKNLGRTEAALLLAGGIDLVSVWESTAGRSLQGHAAGVEDAHDALLQAQSAGLPAGRPIFFAVDFDAQPAQMPAIRDYFLGVRSVLDNAGPVNFPMPVPVGVYGGIAVVKYLLDRRVVSYAWQTYAWSHGQVDGRAGLYQFSNGHQVGGVGVDYNRARRADFGQWGFKAKPPKPRTTMHYERYDTVPRSYCSDTVEAKLARRYDELRTQQKPWKHPHKAEIDGLRVQLDCHAARLRSLILAHKVNCKTGLHDTEHWCWRQWRLGRRAAGKTVRPDKR